MVSKKTLEIRTSTVVIFSILLVALVVTVIGVMMYSKMEKAQKIEEGLAQSVQGMDESSVKDRITIPDGKLDVNSDIVKELYSYVLQGGIEGDDLTFDLFSGYLNEKTLEGNSFYKDSKITYSDLDNKTKVFSILKSFKKNDIKRISKSEIKNVEKLKEIADWEPVMNEIDVYENVNDVAKKVFGYSENIQGETYYGYGGTSWFEYANNNYYKFYGPGGGDGIIPFGQSKMINAEKEGDNIYIYDKYIWLNPTIENNGETYEDKIFEDLYTSSTKKEKIATIETGGEYANLIDKYYNQLNTYKHTFKQNADGSYYWVSTEPVK